MLTLIILIPFFGALLILPMSDTLESHSQMKKIALTTSLINLFISLLLWYQFDSSTNQYQFVSEFNQLNFCHLNFGLDGISLYFVLLTTFVTPIALLSNYTTITKSLKFFLISFLVLETLQICAFVSLDLLLFYIFFESVLPILFIVIVLFGHGNDKFRSAFYFFLYTLGGSLPMLLSILYIYSQMGSTDFQFISLYEISLESQKILWLGIFLAFAVKTPLYPFIIWLPKAHSDSPLAGSILLAATILKLASYGYLRVLINLLPDATNYFSPLILTVAILSLIYASLSTIIQQDSKILIAYSSIAHMGVVVLGLFSNNLQGIEGAILLAIGHGFTSPALFICVGGIIYDRTGTRIIDYIRGLVTYMPIFTIFFFIFTLCNTGIPLSINWLGEQLSLMGIWQQNPVIACLGSTGILLSACYSILLYNRISYGNLSPYLAPLKDLTRREYYMLISLLIPTVVFGILPNVLLTPLHIAVTSILYVVPSICFFSNSDLGSSALALLQQETVINTSIVVVASSPNSPSSPSSAYFRKLNSIQVNRSSGIINYSLVMIDNKKIIIDWNSYLKREQRYEDSVTNLTRSITIYNQKYIIKYFRPFNSYIVVKDSTDLTNTNPLYKYNLSRDNLNYKYIINFISTFYKKSKVFLDCINKKLTVRQRLDIVVVNADKKLNNKYLNTLLLGGILLSMAAPSLIYILTGVNLYDQDVITNSIYSKSLISIRITCALSFFYFCFYLAISNIDRLKLSIFNKTIIWAPIIVGLVNFENQEQEQEQELKEEHVSIKPTPTYMKRNKWPELSENEISASAKLLAEENKNKPFPFNLDIDTDSSEERKGIPICYPPESATSNLNFYRQFMGSYRHWDAPTTPDFSDTKTESKVEFESKGKNKEAFIPDISTESKVEFESKAKNTEVINKKVRFNIKEEELTEIPNSVSEDA